MPWQALHGAQASQAELDRLDYQRSLAELGPVPGDVPSLAELGEAGRLPAGAAGAEPPPYLENPPDTYLASPPRAADGKGKPQLRLTGYRGPWAPHVRRVSTLRTLRAAVEHATGVRILASDGTGYPEPCGVDGWVETQRLANDVVNRRFQVAHCNRRDRCPTCSVAYGEQRGDELYSILAAAAAAASDRRPSDAAGFRCDVTFPPPVAELLARRIAAGDIEGARAVVAGMARITEQVIWRVLKRPGLDRRALGMALNVHVFHSRAPLSEGLHPHVHATLPNAVIERGDGAPGYRVLRHKAKLSPEALARGRAYLVKRVRAVFGELVDLSGYERGVWKWGILNSDAALRKRALYVSRSPYHDVAKLAERRPGFVYSDVGMARLAAAADRQAFVQSHLRVRRYRGFLAPGSRKDAGFRPVPRPDGPTWQREAGGYRRIERYDETGVYLRVFGAVETIERMEAGQVVWGPRAPPRRWELPAGAPA